MTCVCLAQPAITHEKKGEKLGSIRKYTGDKPGYSISVEKVQPLHPGLVLKFSDNITSAITWAAQIIVNHLSHMVYVYLRRRTKQEETLEVNVFEL